MVTYNAFNSRILRFYFYPHAALGKKSPTGLSRTANVFVFNDILGVSTKASSKKVFATTIGNRK